MCTFGDQGELVPKLEAERQEDSRQVGVTARRCNTDAWCDVLWTCQALSITEPLYPRTVEERIALGQLLTHRLLEKNGYLLNDEGKRPSAWPRYLSKQV